MNPAGAEAATPEGEVTHPKVRLQRLSPKKRRRYPPHRRPSPADQTLLLRSSPNIRPTGVPRTHGDDVRTVLSNAANLYFALIAAFIYRFGWLGNLVAASCLIWLGATPLTTDTSAWYFGWGLAGAAVVLGLGVYGFITAIGGQRLFREGFFGDE